MTENEKSVVGLANGAIKALTATPALLVVVLLNLILIGLASYILYDLVNDVGARQQLMLERCLPHTSQTGAARWQVWGGLSCLHLNDEKSVL